MWHMSLSGLSRDVTKRVNRQQENKEANFDLVVSLGNFC